jgi:hypothetical protein
MPDSSVARTSCCSSIVGSTTLAKAGWVLVTGGPSHCQTARLPEQAKLFLIEERDDDRSRSRALHLSGMWSPACSSSSLSARDLRREGVESVLPEPPESRQPSIDVAQRRRVERIHAASSFMPHGREAVFAQHLQVLRDPGLRHREFALDELDELARRSLALRERLEDVAPYRSGGKLILYHGLPTT